MTVNLPHVFSFFKYITATLIGFNHFKDKSIILIIVKINKQTKK